MRVPLCGDAVVIESLELVSGVSETFPLRPPSQKRVLALTYVD